jgi:hypothetical protein
LYHEENQRNNQLKQQRGWFYNQPRIVLLAFHELRWGLRIGGEFSGNQLGCHIIKLALELARNHTG